MNTRNKWICAIVVVGIAVYFVWKSSSKTGAATVTADSGAPDTGGLTLADNPSANPFRDLIAAIAPNTAGAGALDTPSLSKPAPRKNGTLRPTLARPNTTRPRQIESILAPLKG